MILEKTIKDLGLLTINLKLHPEVMVEIKLNIARSEEEAISQFQEDVAEENFKISSESEISLSRGNNKNESVNIVDVNISKENK